MSMILSECDHLEIRDPLRGTEKENELLVKKKRIGRLMKIMEDRIYSAILKKTIQRSQTNLKDPLKRLTRVKI